MKEELYDLIYRSVFSAVTAVFLFFEIYNHTDLEAVSRGNVISVIVISLAFNVLLTLYRKVRLYMIPAVVLVGLILYLTTDKNDVGMFIESIFFSLIIIAGSAFAVFLICDRIMPLNMIVAGGAFIYVFMSNFLGYDVYPASVSLAVFNMIAVLTRFLRNGTDNSDPGRMRKYITFLFPFILAFLLILTVLPKPEKPISWNWVERLYEYTSEKINLLIHRITTKYSLIDSGYYRISFGMDEKLTYDNRSGDEGELFEITPLGSMIGSLYLKGEVFNEFSDGEWHNTVYDERDLVKTDTAETLASAEKNGEIPKGSILKENTINVRFLDIISPIVFMPAKMTAFFDISAGKKTKPVNEHLTFSDNVSYGSEYRVSFFQMNLGNTVFTDYMNAPADRSVMENKDFIAYRDYITKNYTSSPIIEDTVRVWLEGSTAGKESGYEKLLALEQALSGFKYSLQNEELPDSVKSEGDFIDYFILEKREGYCVHFATVFCLLARYMGYPSRIVRGYKAVIPMYATTVVKNGCGHSWPEVYFEGKGWIPFEPTPGMAEERYAGWTVSTGKIRNDYAHSPYRSDTEPGASAEEEAEDIRKDSSASWILFAAIAGIVLFSFILLASVRLILQRRRYGRMNTKERYYSEFGYVMITLAEIGAKRPDTETMTEFGERAANIIAAESSVRGELITELGSELKECIGTHEKCIYGGCEPNEDDTAKLQACRKMLEAYMRECFGKTYLLHRLHLLLEKSF